MFTCGIERSIKPLYSYFYSVEGILKANHFVIAFSLCIILLENCSAFGDLSTSEPSTCYPITDESCTTHGETRVMTTAVREVHP